jgi:hypothetical protein
MKGRYMRIIQRILLSFLIIPQLITCMEGALTNQELDNLVYHTAGLVALHTSKGISRPTSVQLNCSERSVEIPCLIFKRELETDGYYDFITQFGMLDSWSLLQAVANGEPVEDASLDEYIEESRTMYNRLSEATFNEQTLKMRIQQMLTDPQKDYFNTHFKELNDKNMPIFWMASRKAFLEKMRETHVLNVKEKCAQCFDKLSSFGPGACIGFGAFELTKLNPAGALAVLIGMMGCVVFNTPIAPEYSINCSQYYEDRRAALNIQLSKAIALLDIYV